MNIKELHKEAIAIYDAHHLIGIEHLFIDACSNFIINKYNIKETKYLINRVIELWSKKNNVIDLVLGYLLDVMEDFSEMRDYYLYRNIYKALSCTYPLHFSGM